MKHSYSLVKGLSSTQIAIIVAVVVIIVVIGAVAGVLLTRKPTTTVVTTTVTSTITTSTTTPVVTTSTTGPIVFYTWWATEGKIALQHLVPAFENTTNIQVQPYVVPGAGGTNAKYAILALIEAGKPPALFQTQFGPNTISYAEAAPNGINSFVNITPYVQKWGLLNNTIYEVFQVGTYNGTMLSVPIDVEPDGFLFINAQLLREYNLPFPYNFSTLIYDTVQLANHGIHPWIIPGGDGGWDQFELWSAIFLSLAGPKLYNEMTYGTINLDNATVQKLINETNYWFLNFTSYDYPGWQSMTWTQGLTLLIQGKAAFQVNGIWVTAYAYDFLNTTAYPPLPQYINNSSVVFIESPFPGTQNYYMLAVGSVGIPVGPQEQQALQLAHFWTSYQGMEIWSKWKGLTYYKNATDYFNTPAQWYEYQLLLNDSGHPQDFVYSLPNGGVFADVFAQINSGLLTLQQVGNAGLSAWNSTLVSAMQEEESEWLAAAKLGLGYLGFPNHPFANYYPPWVTNPAAYGLKSSKSDNNNSFMWIPLMLVLLGSVTLVSDVSTSKGYFKRLFKILRINS
ncbi:ABC transporter substrate-binding protein [Sulfolobus sp. A20-N-F6]|uniref:glucose ABC transporter substrate-binding protein GlcS n=1 Tax=Sulfolobaceae TaxID=118883 RepID=UPI0009F49B89|nr:MULTISPECIES: glucose ABC transporter substrate-binding protein GlcS [unclassified Sulfolobus]TRM83272.1 ABC transporter substrate-binding protein [Sulfolobus sp. A20-N-F6]TRM96567.1 ABC transporter substrate-binding protein [Sulfolobus sp. B1]TRN01801.1 ABC transporter substrate-binding protein [Sulfolobus sp. F1]